MTGEELKAIDALRERRIMMERLVNSEGWQVFAKVMESCEAQAYELMANTSVSHDAAKHMGAWHAIRNMRTWPERERMAIAQQIEFMNQSAAQRMAG